MLIPSTINEHTVKDSFYSPSKMLLPSLFVRILDMESVFTYTPLEETIGTCVNSHFKDNNSFEVCNKNYIEQNSRFSKKNYLFYLSKKLCKPVDGVTGGSPLSDDL